MIQLPAWTPKMESKITQGAYQAICVRAHATADGLQILFDLYCEDDDEATYMAFYRLSRALSVKLMPLKLVISEWFQQNCREFLDKAEVEAGNAHVYVPTMFYDMAGALDPSILDKDNWPVKMIPPAPKAEEVAAIPDVKLDVWISGLCEPVNPGGTSAYAVSVLLDDTTIWSVSRIVGNGYGFSTNVSEYVGLVAFLTWYCARPVHFPCTIYSNSIFMVNQMKGIWRAKGGKYFEYFQNAQKLIHDNKLENLLTFYDTSNDYSENPAENICSKTLTDAGIKPGVVS